MSCPPRNHACLHCTTTPAAIAARAQLGDTFTIHASAARRPRFIDIQASARELRIIASRRSSFGVQLAGAEFDHAVNMLVGQSQETIEAVLGASGMNSLTTLAIKHALSTRR